MRRLLGMIMLLLAAGTLSPAAMAAAHRPVGPVPQRFGVRLVDVPVDEAHNPRALRYIVDYLPTGTVIHRRILILNQEPRTAHFTVYPDAAQIRRESFTGDAGATRSELTSGSAYSTRRSPWAPGASVMDMVTIKVPRGATRGEHYAVIWVQQAAHVRAATGFGVNERGQGRDPRLPGRRAWRRPADELRHRLHHRAPVGPRLAVHPASTWRTPAGGPST